MWEYNINVIGMVIAAAVVLFNIVLLKKLIGKFGGKAGKELWFAVTLVCAAGACYLIPYFAESGVYAAVSVCGRADLCDTGNAGGSAAVSVLGYSGGESRYAGGYAGETG